MKKKSSILLLFLALLFTSFFSSKNAKTPETPATEQVEEAPQPATPATTPEPSAPTSASVPSSDSDKLTASYESSFGKMIFSLLGLFLLIILSIWFLRRMKNAGFKGNSYQKSVRILERKPISPKSTLYVIEAMGKKILISESQHEVRALT
ncbi:MAG: hypothetical protein HKM07_06615, partial [Chlamydiae bacterium]|nr:hypothetical protein [Chlamydiota bacterium]